MHVTLALLRRAAAAATHTTPTFNPRRPHTKMMNRVVKIYKDVMQVGDVKDAQILSVNTHTGESSVKVTKSHRNLTKKDRMDMVSHYLVRSDAQTTIPPPPHPVIQDKNVLLESLSPSGRVKVQVMKAAKDSSADSTGTDSDTRKCGEYMVITDLDMGLAKTVDLASLDKHGKVYEDAEFGSLEFSPDEIKVAYIAEKKYPKPSSFLSKEAGEEEGRGKEFLHRDEWGEQLVGKSQSVVCVLDRQTEEVTAYTLPDGLCPGQLSFSSVLPSTASWTLVGVGFVSRPYRLGLIYCRNRESRLFQLTSDGTVELLGSAGWNIVSPRLSNDHKQLAFLRSTVGGPHAKCSQLCVMNMVDRHRPLQERVVIDIVNREMEVGNSTHAFRGVYAAYGLPRRCWDSGNTKIFFSAPRLATVAAYCVCVETGSVVEVPSEGMSQRVWDVHGDKVLLERTSMCTPSFFVLMQGVHPEADIREVTDAVELPYLPRSYLSRWILTNPEPHPNPQYSDLPISALYLGPLALMKGEKKRPLIVWPHGGPHSCFVDEFKAPFAFFVRLGFSILWPNYRGSTGAGQDGIDSLPGYVGRTDVSDVISATTDCLRRFPDVLDPSRVFVFGGSHGGFLSLHLAAQSKMNNGLYRAVSARNPVVDIATMTGVSDIPDWCYVESGQAFSYGAVPNVKTLSEMMAASPISKLDAITIPVLLLVGKNDLRVPPSQALHLYQLLQSRGVQTELLLYPDCHSLAKVGVEMDCLINTLLWFQRHGADLPGLTEADV